MATTVELAALGFACAHVAARRVDIAHDDPHGLGPFCRLTVDDDAPDGPGAYAWVLDGIVMYVGKASRLRCITQGAKLGRAYNDYTYIPASQCRNASDPRVRVNGLLNAAIREGATPQWWWMSTSDAAAADRLEADLISRWQPAWNRAGIRPSADG